MVPVLRDAQAHDLWSSAAEIARLADAARSGKAVRDELTGSTITITSLGTLGGIVTTPVINHPEVAIVGVNRIAERPVIRDGAVVARQLMNLSSSFDHRVVDGADAAAFIQTRARATSSTRRRCSSLEARAQARARQQPAGRPSLRSDGFHQAPLRQRALQQVDADEGGERQPPRLTKSGLPGMPRASESRMNVPATRRTSCQEVMA